MLFWLAGLLWAVVIGWLGYQLERQGIAPVLLLPFCLGAVLGGGVRLLEGRLCPARFSVWRGVLVAVSLGALALVVEDALDYRNYRQGFDAAAAANDRLKLAQLANPDVRPLGAGEFIVHRLTGGPKPLDGLPPTWWQLDGLALLVGAAVVSGWGRRGGRTPLNSSTTTTG